MRPPESVVAELIKVAGKRSDESESKRRARLVEAIASSPEFQLA
jgi:hypothetical protein